MQNRIEDSQPGVVETVETALRPTRTPEGQEVVSKLMAGADVALRAVLEASVTVPEFDAFDDLPEEEDGRSE